jgi:hypothetical protein
MGETRNSYRYFVTNKLIKELRDFSLRTNYTDRSTTACRPSKCQLLRIDGVIYSAQQITTVVFSDF